MCGSALSTGSWAGPTWPRPPGPGPSRRRAPPSVCSPGILSSPPARRQQPHHQRRAGASGTFSVFFFLHPLKDRELVTHSGTKWGCLPVTGREKAGERVLIMSTCYFLLYLIFMISFGSLQECQTQTHSAVRISNLVKVTTDNDIKWKQNIPVYRIMNLLQRMLQTCKIEFHIKTN